MKTDKELVQELLDNITSLNSGLCNLALKLFSNEEASRVLDIIHNNKPSHITVNLYWWKCGEISPRRNFLNNLIVKL